MPALPELTPRLAAVAELIPPCAAVADVGTDHAYMPVCLVASGRVTRAIASDIRPGPLERARETVCRFGLEGRVELVLCDGLSNIDTRTLDYVIIAGMGGETEAEILEKAAREGNARCPFILQPMSKAPRLRRRLASAGFEVYDWRLAREGSRIYEILAVCVSNNVEWREPWLTLGRKTPPTAEPWPLYARKTLSRLNRELKGLRASASPDCERISRLEGLISEIMEEMENDTG